MPNAKCLFNFKFKHNRFLLEIMQTMQSSDRSSLLRVCIFDKKTATFQASYWDMGSLSEAG